MIKKIILLLFMCLFLTNCNKTPLEKVLKDIKNNHPKTITLSDYTNFKWDEAWLIYGNVGVSYLNLMRDQNINVERIDDTIKMWKEFSNTIVYIYNKKVVYYEFPPDNRDGEIFGFAEPFSLLDFNLERGQIIVLSSNNSECEVKGKTLIPIKPIKIYENMDKKLK
ncbi:hypothetical protein [Gilliamella sp. ESL0443]|uniref:hypothetical protein n=1 Tax=Gilliamella sp. ESL0443 TaxID=2704655 RepID=UPI001C69ED35|nr:hypothetical protein [Gilliamella sp. ESL0443]QYN42773.1 hypothetical protein GYM76_08485 [Gilliamella sp. ESL0443]